MLHIKKLFKKFGTKKVLHDVSFELPTGGIGVLLGSSGSGKSTLLRIIAGLESFDSGDLLLNNEKLPTKQVGMVFQHFNLFENLTVKENITFPLCKGRTRMSVGDAEKIAIELLQKYGLYDFAEKFPDELSGGQKQRLAILRTIAQKPTIICFDEPTSALDPLLKGYVAQAITELALSGYTVLVATHDVQLVEQLSCIIFLMQGGSIVETAESRQFLTNKVHFPKINQFIYNL